MQRKIYFVVDESYDKNFDGFYVINFLVFESKDVFIDLVSGIEDFLQKLSLKEFKNHSMSASVKNKFFKVVERKQYKSYYCVFNLKKGETLTNLHLEGVKRFTEFMLHKFSEVEDRPSFDFRVDNVGGPKYQEQCKKMVRSLCAQKKIKADILFSDSQKQICLQMADLFAGEIRRNLKGKVEIAELLQKSKNLQE